MNESSCSTFSPVIYCQFLDLGHCNRYLVVSNCYFCSKFPDDTDVECLFICLFSICISSLASNMFSVFKLSC